MRDNALSLVADEETFFLSHDGAAELLLELGPLLERFRADAIVCEHLDDMARDARDVLARARAVDDANVERLRQIRGALPQRVIDEALADPVDGARERWSLPNFDTAIDQPVGLEQVSSYDDTQDRSRTRELAFHLLVALCIGEEHPDREVDEIGWAIRAVQNDQEHAFRETSVKRRTMAGFALQRLEFILDQLNPTPEHRADWDAYMAENLHQVLGRPHFLRSLVHGGSPASDSRRRDDVTLVDRVLRIEVRRVCRDLRRRISATRSRVALIRDYALRCSWYDAAEMAKTAAKLVGKRTPKEDPLSDHLARFLFDAGLRPLTRAMIGRLVPDAFDGTPFDRWESSFYVEAKQYVDDRGAAKAIRDGARQIWNSADRIRMRYPMREAFLVVFRRGGPHLRFPDEVRSGDLVVRPVLVDVASGKSSGSRAGKTIHVSEEQLLADLRGPSIVQRVKQHASSKRVKTRTRA
jgi:hypothetical protein